MIDATTYATRRDRVRELAEEGAVAFLPGHRMVPRNYPDNVYPFRQNSHFLYYTGLSRADLALVVTGDEDILFGPPEDIDSVVWHGPHETLEEAAERAGIQEVRDIASLEETLAEQSAGRVHYLVPYQANVLNWVAELLHRSPGQIRKGGSPDLARIIFGQRSVKSDDEIAEIEEALEVTALMHQESFRCTRPGATEASIAAAVQEIALARGRAQSYNPIVTVHGEVLHNDAYHNRLERGQLLLNDSGAESTRYYASDITRTCPVGGKFTDVQREIYEVVLQAQLGAIEAIRPGVLFRDVHLVSCRIMAQGLIDLGLMMGDADEAVAAGAHALFFPHGVGHMLGLDVHDMEDLGDLVGYLPGEQRSDQFGLNFLRLARPLEPGFVVTVEPGIYFIPALIDRWREQGHLREFIAYDKLNSYRDFGGIRIEDDVLCTADGSQVLGPSIPKAALEVEAAMASS